MRLAQSEGGYCDFLGPRRGGSLPKGVTWSKALGRNCSLSLSPWYSGRQVLAGRECQRRSLRLHPDLLVRPQNVRVVLIQFTPQSLWSSAGFWLRWRCRKDQSPKV